MFWHTHACTPHRYTGAVERGKFRTGKREIYQGRWWVGGEEEGEGKEREEVEGRNVGVKSYLGSVPTSCTGLQTRSFEQPTRGDFSLLSGIQEASKAPGTGTTDAKQPCLPGCWWVNPFFPPSPPSSPYCSQLCFSRLLPNRADGGFLILILFGEEVGEKEVAFSCQYLLSVGINMQKMRLSLCLLSVPVQGREMALFRAAWEAVPTLTWQPSQSGQGERRRASKRMSERMIAEASKVGSGCRPISERGSYSLYPFSLFFSFFRSKAGTDKMENVKGCLFFSGIVWWGFCPFKTIFTCLFLSLSSIFQSANEAFHKSKMLLA